MTTPGRTTRLTLAATALALAAFLVWGRPVGGGFPLTDRHPEEVRAERLALGMARHKAFVRFKEGLMADLVAGRLKLREAVSRLSDYLGEEPRVEGLSSGQDYLAYLPGATHEERCACSLLLGVRDRLSDSPEQAGRLAARLERELAEGR